MYIPEKVTVGFHEGKRILMPEKIGVSAIAMKVFATDYYSIFCK